MKSLSDTGNLGYNHEYRYDNQGEKLGSSLQRLYSPKQIYPLNQGWDDGALVSNVGFFHIPTSSVVYGIFSQLIKQVNFFHLV